MRTWSDRLTAAANGTEPIRHRLRALYRVGDEIAALAAPFAPCKRGCSACCHQPVMLAQPEAEMLGAAIGVKPRRPKSWPFFDEDTGMAQDHLQRFAESFHTDPRPCPFLKHNACSIYTDRPLACRIHINMAPSAESCQMDAARETATLDLRTLDKCYAMIMRTAKLTDIREYF